MIDLMVKMIGNMPMEEIKDKNLLILKGKHKIPNSISGVLGQLKYKR